MVNPAVAYRKQNVELTGGTAPANQLGLSFAGSEDGEAETTTCSGLLGVREAAKQERKTRFTAPLHHVSVPLLLDSFYALKRDAVPGVDGVTWKEYKTDLDKRLQDLHSRVRRGTYRAQPSKRGYIPKVDGRQRPLDITAPEDKIVQYALVTVLTKSMKRTSWGSPAGSVPDEASIKRWMRSG